jgi:hypothetical protein
LIERAVQAAECQTEQGLPSPVAATTETAVAMVILPSKRLLHQSTFLEKGYPRIAQQLLQLYQQQQQQHLQYNVSEDNADHLTTKRPFSLLHHFFR